MRLWSRRGLGWRHSGAEGALHRVSSRCWLLGGGLRFSIGLIEHTHRQLSVPRVGDGEKAWGNPQWPL